MRNNIFKFAVIGILLASTAAIAENDAAGTTESESSSVTSTTSNDGTTTATTSDSSTISEAAVKTETYKLVKYSTKIINNKGEEIGSLQASDGGKGVVTRITLNKGALVQGWHGAHFHMVGDCSDTAGFEHSKSHLKSGSMEHGLLNPKGAEEGDLTNIFANADGSANAELYSHNVNLEGGANPLKDADGTALIIHAASDDHISQPIGNAGARVACAVIK